jgi:hypothetical protein
MSSQSRIARSLATVAFIAGVFGATPAAHAATNKCKLKGSTTLAANGYARAFAKNGTATVCVKKTGRRLQLQGADPSQDVFTLGGKFIGFSSAPTDGETTERTMVNVVHISDGRIPQFLPDDTGGHVDAIVVKPNGAAAWAISPLDDPDMAYVQGTDRANHSPDLLSDSDLGGVDTSTLASGAGGHIAWTYTDGTSGDADLFTEPANLF